MCFNTKRAVLHLMRLGFVVLLSAMCSNLLLAAGLSVEKKSVSAAGRSFGVRVVRVPLDTYRVKIGLARGKVCATESLAGIAKRYRAVAAINGCFFNAYTSDSIKPPYHHLITNGRLVHVGNTGTTIGFDADGGYRMGRVKARIKGSLDGSWNSPNNWYAYYINHPVENSTTISIFDDAWVSSRTPGAGVQAEVRGGQVVANASGSRLIPRDGYVVLFSGREAELASRLQTGRTCEWRTEYEADDSDWWANVKEAIACGPRLIGAGSIAYDPVPEGFKSPKILSNSGQRSAVGVTRDGRTLLLVTCGGATVRQLADVMKALGAWDAMNLDGGASSSLWANGSYITNPGRDIGNALMVIKK